MSTHSSGGLPEAGSDELQLRENLLRRIEACLGAQCDQVRKLMTEVQNAGNAVAPGVLQASTEILLENRSRYRRIIEQLLEHELDINRIYKQLMELDILIRYYQRLVHLSSQQS
ncbi:MAG: hypothetical protein ACAI44_11985 [Candidatus Sericytochromatia bacterium]